jgi:hypothetical protein
MPPVISASLAFVVASFGPGHRCAWNTWHCGINWRSINRPSIARDFTPPIVYSGRGSRSSGLPGEMPWHSFSPVR